MGRPVGGALRRGGACRTGCRPGASHTEAQRLADDVQAIQCAIDDGDARGALRRVDGHVDMAPETKALAVLPGLFPRATKPLPPRAVAEPTPADVEHFKRTLR